MENQIGCSKFVKLEFLWADVARDGANDKSKF